MGNKVCRIGLRTEKQEYDSGEVVRGRVYVSLPKGVPLEGIMLRLEGSEHSEVYEKQNEDHNRSQRTPEYIRYVNTETIVRTDFPLVHQTLEPNRQYEFPFELPLPQGLPNSMYCAHSDGKSFVEVKYILTAITNGTSLNQASQVLSIRDISNSHLAAQPIIMDTEIFPVKTCCCWDHGTVEMGWDADKDVLVNGETVTVNVDGSNRSQVEVKHLTAKIVETVTWRATGVDKQLVKTVKEKLVSQKIPVNDAWQWRSNNNGQSTARPFTAHLQIPPHTRVSYNGRIMSVRHTLVVKASTSGACTTSPESAVQIQLVHKRQGATYYTPPPVTPSAPPSHLDNSGTPQYAQAEVLPDDWNPVQADVIVLPVASAVVVPDEPASAQRTIDHGYAESSNPRLVQLQSILASRPESFRNQLDQFATTIQNLTPREYSQMLVACGPAVGRLSSELAHCMGDSFTTRHLLASLWAVAPSYRIPVIQSTGGLPVDLPEHCSLIEQELSRNELMYFRTASGLKY